VDAETAASLLELAERAGPGLQGLNRTELLEQLETRHDDLLAAMQWFLDQGQTDEALRIARSLPSFWMATRRLDEGSEWFDRILDAPAGDDVNRGGGCFDAGLLVFWTGDDERAAARPREALEIGRRIGDPTVTGRR
jgi:hypothetical protein